MDDGRAQAGPQAGAQKGVGQAGAQTSGCTCTASCGSAPAIYWPDARLAYDPEPDAGPVLVVVECTVTPERQPAFLEAMEHLRRSRLRTGATRWELYRDGERPDRFIELFSVPSWEEHLRQHAGRLTAADREVEEAALTFSDPPPRADHLLPPSLAALEPL